MNKRTTTTALLVALALTLTGCAEAQPTAGRTIVKTIDDAAQPAKDLITGELAKNITNTLEGVADTAETLIENEVHKDE